MKGPKVYVCRVQNPHGQQLNSMTEAPKWAYLMSGILIVIGVILAFAIVTVVFSLLGLHSLWEIDIQILLLYVILPLSILTILIILTMAILLTRKRE
ncbi:MAG: hypothetical protein EAX95_06290 [Candidatus Thorarchaeota archaeon]|nr:hypothetical protein [Candidatus Thorarchaeota archaeon]